MLSNCFTSTIPTNLIWGNPCKNLFKVAGKWYIPLAQFQNSYGSQLTSESKAARALTISISSMPLLWPWPWTSALFSVVGPEHRCKKVGAVPKWNYPNGSNKQCMVLLRFFEVGNLGTEKEWWYQLGLNCQLDGLNGTIERRKGSFNIGQVCWKDVHQSLILLDILVTLTQGFGICALQGSLSRCNGILSGSQFSFEPPKQRSWPLNGLWSSKKWNQSYHWSQGQG